jgi:ubiquitin thioesterase protein OTUB1
MDAFDETSAPTEPRALSSDAAELDRQTQARLEEIESQVRAEQPLTSSIRPLAASLEPEYRDAAAAGNFLAGVQALGKTYNRMRMVRGDGNCYYRAFLYSLAENFLQSPLEQVSELLRFIKEEVLTAVLSAGYDPDMLEVFYDSLVDLVERIAERKLTAEQFHEEMNQENSTSDYCTWFLRVVTAVHLKTNADRFLPFMEGGIDIESFCKTSVEPMGKECENVQVLALAEALGIQVVVAYLDGHDLVGGNVSQHVFGPTDGSIRANLHFLYRPGHYDILYPL